MFDTIGNLFKKKAKDSVPEVEGQRHNDGVLLIEQDNRARKLTIQASNHNAQKLLGYNEREIINKDLRDFLTGEEVDQINEFTEFEDGEKDFAEVVSKMRYFKMMAKWGEYIPLRLRIVRAISQQDKSCFQLIFNDDIVRERLEHKRELEKLARRGNEILDPISGLLSYESVLKDIEILSFYEGKRETSSVLVAFEIKNFISVSMHIILEEAHVIEKKMAEIMNFCKREEDISAKINDGKFLLILVDTPEKNVEIPIKRVLAKFTEFVDSKSFHVKPVLSYNYNKISAKESAEKQIIDLFSENLT
jgi:GGDEF domain-containing protein